MLRPCISTLLIATFLTIAPSQAQISIGVSAPLTGEAAAWGSDLKNVLEFANQKLGGKASFILEDDRCDPTKAVSVAKKLTSVDKVSLVFTLCGAVTLAVGPMYEKSGVVVMAPLATPSRISGLGSHIFRAALSDQLAASLLANHISRRHTTIGVLTEQNEYSVNFLNDFRENAEKLGVTLIEEGFQSGDADFKLQLLRIKARNPDAVFLNTNVENPLSIALKQMREMKWRPQVYGAYLPGSSAFLTRAGQLAEGIVFVDFPPAEELLNEQGQKMYQEFIARYGPLQSWSFAFPACFEALRASVLALRSGTPLHQFIGSTQFDGIFGKYSFDTRGDIVGLRHSMRRIENGRSVALAK